MIVFAFVVVFCVRVCVVILLIVFEQESSGVAAGTRRASLRRLLRRRLSLAPCTLCCYSVSRISSPPPPFGRRMDWVGGLLRRSLSCRCMLPDEFCSFAHC